MAFSLSSLSPKKGSTKSRTRLGRGIGTGKGKTCGRGHKGQKSRSGVTVAVWFEGGAMPFYRKVPKRGFTSRQRIYGTNVYNIVNLCDLDQHFADGETVNLETLNAKGYGTNQANKAGIKVLAYGEISKKLTLQVHSISEAAQAKIEAAGGSVEIA
jgi:large subunit ribosomal protein L15